MKSLFKPGIFLLSALVLFSACTSKAERTRAEVETLLDSMEAQFAPDTRIELWNISVLNMDGKLSLEGEVASKAAFQGVSSSISASFPSVENHLKLLPETGAERLVNALVNNSVTHLRRSPSSKAELVSQALLGTPVRILKEEEGMLFIQIPDGYLGWVNVNEVHFLEPDELSRYSNLQKIIYHSQYGFSYCEPAKSSLPVADLVIGCMLPVVSEKEAFYQVEYPDGRLAWVKRDEAIPSEDVFFNNQLLERIVVTALAFNGVPYLWGGVSAKNLDCSGLVSNVYFMNGIQMPRDADQQSLCGREISTEYDSSELVVGDLLFFGMKATAGQEERVNHVAIYIGQGEFIHAAGYRDRVSINSMDSTQGHFIDTYPEIFVRASRIIGEENMGFQPVAENAYYKEIIKEIK